MSALTKNRNTLRREGTIFVFTAAATIFQGGMVAVDSSGHALPASASTGPVIGMALNPAQAGEQVDVVRGCYAFGNAVGADAVKLADVGQTCFVADDQTVKKTAGSPAAPIAGKVLYVNDDGVWVQF